jgi:hypothetical protein
LAKNPSNRSFYPLLALPHRCRSFINYFSSIIQALSLFPRGRLVVFNLYLYYCYYFFTSLLSARRLSDLVRNTVSPVAVDLSRISSSPSFELRSVHTYLLLNNLTLAAVASILPKHLLRTLLISLRHNTASIYQKFRESETVAPSHSFKESLDFIPTHLCHLRNYFFSVLFLSIL